MARTGQHGSVPGLSTAGNAARVAAALARRASGAAGKHASGTRRERSRAAERAAALRRSAE